MKRLQEDVKKLEEDVAATPTPPAEETDPEMRHIEHLKRVAAADLAFRKRAQQR